MKKYINEQGAIFAYELDGSQDAIIPLDHKAITDEEALFILNPPLTDAEQKAAKNLIILERINTLELSQNRSVREAVIALPGAMEKLLALNNDIAALRSQLVF